MDDKTSPLYLLQDPSLLKTDALIGGEWIRGASRFEVFDPATGQRLADVAQLGATEAEQAIAAADKAWPAWRAKTAKERATILMKWPLFCRIMQMCELLHMLLGVWDLAQWR